MIVVGLDVDTRNIGVAITQDGLPVALGTVKLRGATFEERLRYLLDNQDALVHMVRPAGRWPHLIALEDRNVRRNQRTNNRLNEMVGAVKSVLAAQGYRGQFINVNASHKLAMVGIQTRWGRAAIKELTISHVSRMCEAQHLPPPANDHEADAVLVARAAYIDARKG